MGKMSREGIPKEGDILPCLKAGASLAMQLCCIAPAFHARNGEYF